MKRLICLATVALLAALCAQTVAVADDGAMSEDAAVTIKTYSFKPGTLRITKGTKVEFTNKDPVPHTVTRNGGGFNSRLSPGEDFTVAFNKKGTFLYHCSLHTNMEGKIVVK